MRDFRFAFRTLRATPVASTVAALSLALGIGANTAIFSLVSSVMLRALPVAEPERLAIRHVWSACQSHVVLRHLGGAATAAATLRRRDCNGRLSLQPGPER